MATARESAMERVRALIEDQGAATAVEYGLIVAAIAAVIVAVVLLLGGKVSTIFADYEAQMP